MQSKQIKIRDFEKKVRQFLYDFFSGALLPETGKGFFNGFPGRVVEYTLVCHSCGSRNLYHKL